MKAQSQFLQVKSSQAVESTSGKPSNAVAGLKNQQWVRVPNRGTVSEKTTRNLYEAFFAMIFVLSLFLTGCSGSATATSQNIVDPSVVLSVSGETAVSVNDDASRASGEAGARDFGSGKTESSLQSFIQETTVAERVRLVVGWLKFVSQNSAAERVELGWSRLNSGKTIGVLNSSPVLERPDLSVHELMMWRQILLQSEADLSNSEASKRLEEVAVMLTLAATPDDLMRVDNVLVVPETVAGY